MPAILNKRIKKILRDFEMAEGMVPGVIKYKFRDESSPEFYLVIVPNKNYNPLKREGKDNKKFFVFATNIEFNSVKEFTKKIPKEYRKRWNIETGYRMKKVFKIRTCSKSFAARSSFFILQCIMHNCLNVSKQVVSITAYMLKSAICKSLTYRSEMRGAGNRPLLNLRHLLGCDLHFAENRVSSLLYSLPPARTYSIYA
ncbi:MAG: hypothetical protein C5S48_10220 [Candidatus Methanogaster sp.]|nr:MAG: hypothetical protein C5S48_10220 [ANME-2 cluster archaeon]